MARVVCALVLAACASSSSSTSSVTTTGPTGPSAAELRAERDRKEAAKRAAIVARHRELESEQQDALGATCTDKDAWAKQQCTPSCYPPEPKASRAGIKLTGGVEIQHRVCELPGSTEDAPSYAVLDELPGKLTAKPFRRRFPKPPKKATWQAKLVEWYAGSQVKKLPKRDAIAVIGTWKTLAHPQTKESLKCVTIAHYTTLPRTKLDDCGATPGTACEVTGNAAARGINLVHYRLAEARTLKAKGDEEGCQKAALIAVATARGMPRWRQYAKLNVGEWKEGLAYKTRFDGLLDEDQLFAVVTRLGMDAEEVYASCGGASAKTTAEQEHAFHSCP